MNRWWMSWIVKELDHRPLTFRPNAAVLGWWCSGSNQDGSAILCGLIEAETVEAARAAVLVDWPGIEWRFVEERAPDYVVKSGRFPLSEWMESRMIARGAE